MIELSFHTLQRLAAHFEVRPDLTPWARTYIKTAHGLTPLRERATFGGIQQVLQPLIHSVHELERATGLYLLAFDRPTPALYVGIAADGRAPEGILRRLRKHCVKALGSNVGSGQSTGGVHHPRQWCEFAVDRYNQTEGLIDDLGDARFTHAQTSEGNSKLALQGFERLVCQNADGVLDGICDRLWAGSSARDIRLLTSGSVRLPAGFEHRIHLW